MATKKVNLMEIADTIIGISPKMRFVGIIDSKGNIVEGIMKKGKASLESQKEQEHFCKQISQRRKMREEFDRSLGKVRYVHVERENVTQLVVYTKRKIIFVTAEPNLDIKSKLQIVNKIKKITSGL